MRAGRISNPFRNPLNPTYAALSLASFVAFERWSCSSPASTGMELRDWNAACRLDQDLGGDGFSPYPG